MRLIVLHGSYGCDTGCCGHYVEDEDGHTIGQFEFSHPNGDDARKFAEDLIREQCGEETTGNKTTTRTESCPDCGLVRVFVPCKEGQLRERK